LYVATIEAIQHDNLAMSIAAAVALANSAVQAQGTDPATCLVTISEETAAPNRSWRIQYGPRNFVNRRGGDFYVVVDESSQQVRQVLRGQ